MADSRFPPEEGSGALTRPASPLQIAVIAVVLGALYLISTVNFLLFHGIVEVAGLAVAFSIFIIVWNTRRVIPDAFFLIMGISFLFFGSIDLVHTLAYKGMGIFPGDSSDLPTQLWIAARYFQSISFLIATLFIGRSITRDRKYDAGIIIAACTAACALIFTSIFVWQNFPHCFIDGSGLTPFKIYSEYLISFILVATIVLLYRSKGHFDPVVWKLLSAAQVFLILGELAFTSYAGVYGFMNMLGHLFRLLSVYLFYRVFVVISLTQPYNLLLRKISEDEYALNERFKELNCLYGISSLLELPGISLDEILEKTAALLPPAMQYPEITEARIELDGQLFETGRFHKTPWILAREILVNGSAAGRVEIGYREERPPIHEGPFMKEERFLINAVAERIGHIIERIQAEDTLRESEEKYRTLFDNMLEGYAYCRMIYDKEGKPVDWVYLDVNKAFSQLTGLGNVTGKRVLEVIPDIRTTTPELFAIYGRVASGGQPETFEIDFKPLNKWLKVSVFSPEKEYFVAVFEDITERRNAEAAVRQANSKLNLLSSITRHDINNQLLSLKAFLELSKESLGDAEKMSEYIVKEERAADAMEHQIVFTKEYQDLGVKTPVWQDVQACIRKALTALQIRDVRVIADVENLEVFADPLFERVFYNLIDNALRYGGQKMTIIRITSQDSDQGLLISVEDDGAGLTADDKKRLFERGFGRHTGLGLFLSSEILAITGITIAETGEPGKGARFEIRVPKSGYRFSSRL